MSFTNKQQKSLKSMLNHKKIGIITFHSAHNYGAMLQAYALQNVLEELNNHVEFINYRNPHIDKDYKVIKFFGSNLRSILENCIISLLFFRKNVKRYKAFNDFMRGNLKLSRCFKNKNDLLNNPPKYQIYLTGSDQVWNPEITSGLDDIYTLNFGDKNIKRISYAASIGNNKIDKKYTADYKYKLHQLDHVSVREEDAQKELTPLFKREIKVVLDPTLLIEGKEWEKKIDMYPREMEEYILVYTVGYDSELAKMVNYLSKKLNIKVIHFGRRNRYKRVFRSAYEGGPFEFLNLIKNAKYIFTNSFHATAFSILFHKNFFVVPPKKRSSRITHLIKKLGLDNRMVCNYEEFIRMGHSKKINYYLVEKKLTKERKKSLEFLKNAINY